LALKIADNSSTVGGWRITLNCIFMDRNHGTGADGSSSDERGQSTDLNHVCLAWLVESISGDGRDVKLFIGGVDVKHSSADVGY